MQAFDTLREEFCGRGGSGIVLSKGAVIFTTVGISTEGDPMVLKSASSLFQMGSKGGRLMCSLPVFQ